MVSPQDGLKGSDERGTGGVELVAVGKGEPLEDLRPPRSELHVRDPAVDGAAPAAHEAALLEAVDELDGAVVLEHQALGQLAHRGDLVAEAPHREQQLVLLRLEARLARGVFREREEVAQPVTELGQRGVVEAHGW
jgi:hypothetical protein